LLSHPGDRNKDVAKIGHLQGTCVSETVLSRLVLSQVRESGAGAPIFVQDQHSAEQRPGWLAGPLFNRFIRSFTGSTAAQSALESLPAPLRLEWMFPGALA
jgi:hypothetical protein